MKTLIGMEVTGGALVIGKHVMMIKIMTMAMVMMMMAMVMMMMAMMMMVIIQMWAGIMHLGGRVGLRHWQLQRERVQVVVCHQNLHRWSSESPLFVIKIIVVFNHGHHCPELSMCAGKESTTPIIPATHIGIIIIRYSYYPSDTYRWIIDNKAIIVIVTIIVVEVNVIVRAPHNH